ncbi:tripartite motif-containing protein 16 isoform X2 [Lampris incognitus]|uniref:tripartite motif-containing protein 16 isoform X2 n=1 Tax=Lampris incognitus TaxID=2546036 RepID=UPI0024B53574|nr:tripartite motif-containing protein 16 isoform X2 [Lampris incognitus]
MGASLDTPSPCSMCYELIQRPVILKCNHRFCQRCLGDLWSVSPNGPYRCPQWKCTTVYKTLPFDLSTAGPSPRSPPPQPRGAAGESRTDGAITVNTTGFTLWKPSTILGKRKASRHVPEQEANTKRLAVDPGAAGKPSSDSEQPTTPVSGTSSRWSTEVETPMIEERPESSKTKGNVNISSRDQPPCSSISNTPEVVFISQNKPPSEPPLIADDSDNCSEVDTCDAPVPATLKEKNELSGMHSPVERPTSPANSKSSPQVSTPGKGKSPLHHLSRPSLAFTKLPASTTAYPACSGLSPKPQGASGIPMSCHYCPTPGQQPAVKTCLVCGASMCSEHLRPHLESPVFQNHTLVAPMEDISLWRCQEHQEINRIYCRQCAMCVCTVCTVIGSHRDHRCISIREAERELRVVLTEARAGVQQQYGAIKEALEQEEQSALQCVRQEENRALGGLESQLSQLQGSLISVQQGLHILEGLADTQRDEQVREQAFIMEYSRTTQMVSDMGSVVEGVTVGAPEEVNHARLNCLQKWTEKRLNNIFLSLPDRDSYRMLYGIVPTLDTDTAHQKLLLSQNNRRVIYSEVQQAYPEDGARFSAFPQVLASRAVEKGLCYWEVEVPIDEGRWKVGLCEGQIGRKGQKDICRLGFNSYSWCLASEKGRVEALHDKVAVPIVTEGLRKVAVFLDFEGILSFFSVTPGGSLTLLHKYKHKFTEPLYPALSVSKTQLTICDLFQMSTTQ